MTKSRGTWPENWRRGPRLGARVRNKRFGERLVLGTALFSLVAVLGLQLMNFGGSTPAQNEASIASKVLAAAPSVSTARATEASPQEQMLWDEAMASRTRASIEQYQKTYPTGLYAAKAQAALASCHPKERIRWSSKALEIAPGHGSVNVPAGAFTEAQACDMAKGIARGGAEQSCRAAINE